MVEPQHGVKQQLHNIFLLFSLTCPAIHAPNPLPLPVREFLCWFVQHCSGVCGPWSLPLSHFCHPGGRYQLGCYFHRNVDHPSIHACELQQFWQAACDLGHSYRGLTWIELSNFAGDIGTTKCPCPVKWMHGNIQFVHTIVCVVSVLCTLPTYFSVVLCLQELFFIFFIFFYGINLLFLGIGNSRYANTGQ